MIMKEQSRRNFIKSAGASLLLPLSSSVLAKELVKPSISLNTFVVPPLNTGVREGNKVSYKLSINSGETEFFKGVNTPTLGLNQSYLGPVLRAKRGDIVSIKVENHIKDVSTVHWHGMTLPANMDGGPHQSINPNQSWTSEFKIRQEAATLWYHSHAMHKTGQQVYHGLAGMFIVDDEGSDQLGLPNEYGVDDIPCTIQDRRFNQDGTFSYMSAMPDHMMGMMGSIVMVNGVVTPTLVAKSTLMRLRLHNGSNARTYNLAFGDSRPFHVIASDCGFLHKPFQTNKVRLAAAERIEILVDVSDRKEVVLKSVPSVDGGGMPMMGMMPMMGGGNQELTIMKIDARQAKQSARKVPTVLRNSSLNLDPKSVTATRQFELEMGMMGRGGMMGGMMNRMGGGGDSESGMFRINGKSMDIKRIDFQVKANSTEIWEISNASPMAHPFHVHNVQFRILDRNGKRPHPSESGLKDVVLVHGNERVKIIMKFPEYRDENVPYMYHCHILEHEDQGMMGQFTVV